MHVVSRYTAADAAGIIEPRGRAIALSVAFAAGALLLNMVPVIGVTGTLSLLTALSAACGAGWGSTRGHSWLYRSPLAATRWAFLLSAAGWLLALVAWYGGQDWPAMLPGVACGVWRGGGGCRLADCGGTVDAVWAQTRWRNAAERGRCHRGDAIGPTHCRGRAQRRVLRLRRAAGPVAARRADRAHQAAGECGVSESGRQMKRDGVSHPAW